MSEHVEVSKQDRERAVEVLCRGGHLRQGFHLVRWEDTGELNEYDFDDARRDGVSDPQSAAALVSAYATEAKRLTFAAESFARVRIAAERAGYDRGVREERGRCAKYARKVSGMLERDAMHADAWVLRVARDIEAGEHAKEGA